MTSSQLWFGYMLWARQLGETEVNGYPIDMLLAMELENMGGMASPW